MTHTGHHYHTVEEAIEILKAEGLKITDKRVDMLKALYNRQQHLTAKDVRKILNKKYPNISPDTIYRNLHTFSGIGLIEETEFEGEKYFRARCDIEGHHHHFICTNCGYSQELEMCPLDFFTEQLNDVSISTHRFELFGLCENCK